MIRCVVVDARAADHAALAAAVERAAFHPNVRASVETRTAVGDPGSPDLLLVDLFVDGVLQVELLAELLAHLERATPALVCALVPDGVCVEEARAAGVALVAKEPLMLEHRIAAVLRAALRLEAGP